MAKKIGIFSMDNGCGKTTTTFFLAAALSAVNKKVLTLSPDKKGKAGYDTSTGLFTLGNLKWHHKNTTIIEGEDTDYDYVLFDVHDAGSLKDLDSVIVPIEAQYYGLEELHQTLKEIKEHQLLEIEGFLITKYDSESTLSSKVKDELILNFPGFVFDTVISRNYYLAIPDFSLVDLNGTTPHSGYIDYLKLANEIIDTRK